MKQDKQQREQGKRLVERTLRKFFLSDESYDLITRVAQKKCITRVSVLELSIHDYASKEGVA